MKTLVMTLLLALALAFPIPASAEEDLRVGILEVVNTASNVVQIGGEIYSVPPSVANLKEFEEGSLVFVEFHVTSSGTREASKLALEDTNH